MSKVKKQTLKCRECGAEFKTTDPQARLCKACIKREAARELPKGPKSIEDMIR